MKNEIKNHEESFNDIRFHKLQLLYKFKKILHKIDEDIEEDAKKANDQEFYELIEEIEEHLEEFVEKLDAMICKK
jgi:hypothetical protein